MDQMWSLFFQVRRIRYPITDDEDSWPGDATSSYAGTHVPNSVVFATDRGDFSSKLLCGKSPTTLGQLAGGGGSVTCFALYRGMGP